MVVQSIAALKMIFIVMKVHYVLYLIQFSRHIKKHKKWVSNIPFGIFFSQIVYNEKKLEIYEILDLYY